MLRTLVVQNFKSIVRAELRLGQVNVFIGPNGSGKSNLLEAIGILSACLDRGIDAQALDHKGVRLSLPHLFKSTFKNRKIPQTFRIESKIDDVSYNVSLRAAESSPHLTFLAEDLTRNGVRILGRSPHGSRIHQNNVLGVPITSLESKPSRSLWDVYGSLVDLDESPKASIDSMSRYAIYAPQTAVMRGVVPDLRPIEPLGLTGGRLAQALEEMLSQRKSSKYNQKRIRKALEIVWEPGWATSLRVSKPSPDVVPDFLPPAAKSVYIQDRFMRAHRNTLSPYDASEGTLYLLFVATLLGHSETPGIFALDNVDGTLNPKLVRSLVQHISEIVREEEVDDSHEESSRPSQVFLTSHNPTALDALDIFDPEQRLFVVSRNNDGHTTFRQVRPPHNMAKEDWIVQRKGRNLSQLWLDGFIRNALG